MTKRIKNINLFRKKEYSIEKSFRVSNQEFDTVPLVTYVKIRKKRE